MFFNKACLIVIIGLFVLFTFNRITFGEAIKDKTLEFADYLYSISEFDRAITEYLRYKFEHQSAQFPEIDYKIALAHEMLNEHNKAVEILGELYSTQSELAEEAIIDIGLIYFKTGRFSNSIDEFDEYVKRYPEGELQDDILYMSAIAHIENHNLSEAREKLYAIKAKDSNYIESAREILDKLDKEKNMRPKSKSTAGVLSAILPGAGQFYVGRNADGITSLLMNSIIAGGAILSFLNDEDVLGGCLAFVGGTFYLGNVYSAIAGAEKYNRDEKKKFIEDILSDARLDLVGSNRDALIKMKLKF